MSDTNTQDAGNTQPTGNAQPGAVASESSAAGGSPPAATFLDGAPNSQQAPEGQTSTEQKPAEANTEGDNTEKPAGESITGAPEAYEFKAPEGSKFDEETIGTFSKVAKELDLSQGAAQKILDAIAPKVAERFMARQVEALQQASTEWQNATRSDKTLGGEKLEENLSVAKKALDAFGTPELRKLLGPYDAKDNPQGTGLGNHPEIIRAFFNAGKAISEDKFVPGGKAPSQGERNAAKALYPNQPA